MASATASTSAVPAGTPEFKLVLVGEGGVGKTTFMTRHVTGEYTELYDPTIGASVRKLPFFTSKGPIVFNCWDTAGQEEYSGLRDGYYLKAACAIIMFDVTSRKTYAKVPKWHTDLDRVAHGIPMVLVGNKVDKDSHSRVVQAKQVTFHRRVGIPYVEISAKGKLNMQQPFLKLIRILARDDTIAITEAPALRPAEVTISDAQKATMEAQLREAEAAPLPDVDEF